MLASKVWLYNGRRSFKLWMTSSKRRAADSSRPSFTSEFVSSFLVVFRLETAAGRSAFYRRVAIGKNIQAKSATYSNIKTPKSESHQLYTGHFSTRRSPKLHQSAAAECPRRFTTSGAMYSTVPQKLYVLHVEPMDSLLRPKSVTLTWPSSSRRTLQSDDLHTHKPKDASLFRLEISISDAQLVQMAERENELGKIEFDVVFCEHDLLGETSEKVAAS